MPCARNHLIWVQAQLTITRSICASDRQNRLLVINTPNAQRRESCSRASYLGRVRKVKPSACSNWAELNNKILQFKCLGKFACKIFKEGKLVIPQGLRYLARSIGPPPVLRPARDEPRVFGDDLAETWDQVKDFTHGSLNSEDQQGPCRLLL